MLLCAPTLLAQAQSAVSTSSDSLVEVFPIGVGYQWTYYYEYRYEDIPYQALQYLYLDTGRVDLRVIGSVPSQDSIRWIVQEVGSHWTKYNDNPFGGPTSTCDTFEIIERTTGGHRLYRTGLPSEVTSSVMPFAANLPDTASPCRYARVDSSGLRTFAVYGSPAYYFSFKEDVGLVYGRTSDGCTCIPWWGTHHLLRTEILASVSSPSGKELAQDFRLEQNYPNPFNPSTTIRYALPWQSYITLSIFNTLGQQVAELVRGELEAGSHEAKFDAAGLPSGVYFYRLRAGDFVQTKKLILLH